MSNYLIAFFRVIIRNLKLFWSDVEAQKAEERHD